MNPLIVTLTGPSCSGKSYLARAMVRDLGFIQDVSFTTRAPRAGEVDGVDYDFLSKGEYKRLLCQGDILETVEFNGFHYGSRVSTFNKIAATGHPMVVVVEPNGAQQFRRWAFSNNVPLAQVFVEQYHEVLLARMVERIKSDDQTSVEAQARRLKSLVLVEAQTWIHLGPWDYITMPFGPDSEAITLRAIRALVEARRGVLAAA